MRLIFRQQFFILPRRTDRIAVDFVDLEIALFNKLFIGFDIAHCHAHHITEAGNFQCLEGIAGLCSLQITGQRTLCRGFFRPRRILRTDQIGPADAIARKHIFCIILQKQLRIGCILGAVAVDIGTDLLLECGGILLCNHAARIGGLLLRITAAGEHPRAEHCSKNQCASSLMIHSLFLSFSQCLPLT